MSDFSRSTLKLALCNLLWERYYSFLKFWIPCLIFCLIIADIPILRTYSQNTDGLTTNFHSLVNDTLCETTKIPPFIVENYLGCSIRGASKSSKESELEVCTLESLPSNSLIPKLLYIHFNEVSNSRFYWVPKVSESPISQDNIPVDLTNAIDPEFSCELSKTFEYLVCLVVYRESGYQPFLGQLLVAEDVIARIRLDNSWNDISKTLIEAYDAQMDENGKLHIYLGQKEILEPSESVQSAVKLALSGSRISSLLLQTVTEFQNEKYGLNLDDSYYKYGALFHYSPQYISESEAKLRTMNLVPVSFQFADHIFYGRWLLGLTPLDF